ncbi:MAG: hypothetical protein M3Z22_08055 [Verrucomicrobiota bacterium]|nr:hypothetical protein [Verrucomicrobiota bacterium]
MKNHLSRNALALVMGASLTFGLLSSRAGALPDGWRVDLNAPSDVSNELHGISALSASDVWAVGDVTPASDLVTRVLAKHWNGVAWVVVPAPSSKSWIFSQFTGVSALAANDVWAVGNFTFVAGTPEQNINSSVIEHFDGVSWKIIQSPQSDPTIGSEYFLTAISALSANDVWAVGFGSPSSNAATLPLYEHWDGTAWTAQFVVPFPGYGSNTDLYSVSAVSPTDVWAAGHSTFSTYDSTFISHWNGQSWTTVPTPNVNVGRDHNDLWSIHGIKANDAWAVGYGPVLNPGGYRPYQEQTLILHWDGISWRIVPSPNVNNGSQGLGSNRLYGVTAVSATDIWADGAWSDAPNFSTRSLIEHWNGVSWSVSPTPTVDPQTCNPDGDCTRNFLASITSLPTGEVWTAGMYFAPLVSELGLILDRLRPPSRGAKTVQRFPAQL